MARYTFGDAIEEDDILEIQGVEYHLMPLGMGYMRRMMGMKELTSLDEDELGQKQLDMAIDVIVESVRPDEREKLRAHIDQSVSPPMLVAISAAIAKGMSDMDPTQLAPSSAGSLPTGLPSTDGAGPVESIPSV